MAWRLDELPYHKPATVIEVDWPALSEDDVRRLRNMGLDEGVGVEALHGGPIGRDPIAVRIGRMTVAMRRAVARSVSVTLESEQAA